MGFEQADRWTICVFYGDIDQREGRRVLRCVAHARAIECDISEARTWPEGVGVGGVAYANAREVIVPDLVDEAMGTVFDLGDRKRSYDEERYRSLAAVPILVDRGEKPWGVVIATNDRPHHFNVEGTGVRTVEAVRALAGMVALAVSVSRAAPRAAGIPPS
jgi:GAF domain-containing protein